MTSSRIHRDSDYETDCKHGMMRKVIRFMFKRGAFQKFIRAKRKQTFYGGPIPRLVAECGSARNMFNTFTWCETDEGTMYWARIDDAWTRLIIEERQQEIQKID